MKTKRFSKKLVLKKNTVANLDNSDMNVLHGGAVWTEERTVCHTKCATDCWCSPTILPSKCPC